MFSRVIVPSLVLAALANGLAFKRDDGYGTSTPALSLPEVTSQPVLLSDPSVSPLFFPPLDPTPTSSVLSLSLPPLDPSSTSSLLSLSLPPLDPTSTPTASLPPSSSLPSVVTTTVYVYPSACSPTGTLQPTPSPSNVPDDTITLPDDESLTNSSPSQPTPITLPDPQVAALKLPPVRRDDATVSQLRALQQQVVNTWVDAGKGNSVLPIVGQLETLIAQAGAPDADGAALLKQAQSLVYN